MDHGSFISQTKVSKGPGGIIEQLGHSSYFIQNRLARSNFLAQNLVSTGEAYDWCVDDTLFLIRLGSVICREVSYQKVVTRCPNKSEAGSRLGSGVCLVCFFA